MILNDVNQSWNPPVAFDFQGADGEGPFAVLAFSQKVFDTVDGLRFLSATHWIHVWVNDQGREVFRTETTTYAPALCAKCGGPASCKGGHGPYCLSAACKWGWEVEEDGSPLQPPVVVPVIPKPWYFKLADMFLDALNA